MRAMGFGIIAGLVIALLLLGTSAPAVEAAQASESSIKKQNEFVQLCRALGGTPKRVASRVVKCTFSNGDSTTCNFKTNRCTHDYGLIHLGGGGAADGAVITDEGPGLVATNTGGSVPDRGAVERSPTVTTGASTDEGP